MVIQTRNRFSAHIDIEQILRTDNPALSFGTPGTGRTLLLLTLFNLCFTNVFSGSSLFPSPLLEPAGPGCESGFLSSSLSWRNLDPEDEFIYPSLFNEVSSSRPGGWKEPDGEIPDEAAEPANQIPDSQNPGIPLKVNQDPRPLEEPEPDRQYSVELFHNHNKGLGSKLRRAEALSLAIQVAGMGVLQAMDVWDSGHRPFANGRENLRQAWTSAPEWDDNHFFYNYLGHPYTGSVTFNLMRSQNASPLASWLFSCSQSLIWEYVLEATEEHPSTQDLLITSNVGSLLGEGAHRLTVRMKRDGLSFKEKILIALINPGYVLNNGFK